MVRVQVLLEKETLDQIRSKSKKEKKSASEIIREVVLRELNKDKSEKRVNTAEMLLDIAKSSNATSGIADLGSNDDYLYRLP